MIHLFGNDKDAYKEIPKGLTLEYKNRQPVYKLNGTKISENRARALIIAANRKPEQT